MDSARAILVDLDDTIIDFSSSAVPSWHAVCAEIAPELPGVKADTLYTAIDRERQWYWSDHERHREGRADLRAASRRIITAALRSVGQDRPDCAQRMAEAYRDRRDAAMALFPGAVETLARWQARGIPLVLVTNGTSAEQRAKLRRFALEPYFLHVFIEGELGFGKPDPRVYERALAHLGGSPEDTWFVGDNLEWDIAAPQRAGLRTVWVDAAGTGLPHPAPARPDRIVQSLAELP